MVASKKSRQAAKDFMDALVNAGREYAVEAIDRMHFELSSLNNIWRDEGIPFSVSGAWEGNKIGYIVSVKDRWKHDVMEIQISPLSSKEAQVISVLEQGDNPLPKNRKIKAYGALDTNEGIDALYSHVRMEIMRSIPAGHQEHVVAVFNGISPKDALEFDDFHAMCSAIRIKHDGNSQEYLESLPKSEI